MELDSNKLAIKFMKPIIESCRDEQDIYWVKDLNEKLNQFYTSPEDFSEIAELILLKQNELNNVQAKTDIHNR